MTLWRGNSATHADGHASQTAKPAAIKRVTAIVAAHGLDWYHQGDPRGCAVYVLRPGDVREGEDKGSVYSRGIAVY